MTLVIDSGDGVHHERRTGVLGLFVPISHAASGHRWPRHLPGLDKNRLKSPSDFFPTNRLEVTYTALEVRR